MTAISVIHAPTDSVMGERIAAALRRGGVTAHRINDISPAGDGEWRRGEADEGAAIVLWSKSSIMPARSRDRARAALERGALIPVAVGGAHAPAEFKNLTPVDLTGWNGDENDPRWRFVIEEINLAAKRTMLKDGAVWPDQNPPQQNEAGETADAAPQDPAPHEESLDAASETAEADLSEPEDAPSLDEIDAAPDEPEVPVLPEQAQEEETLASSFPAQASGEISQPSPEPEEDFEPAPEEEASAQEPPDPSVSSEPVSEDDALIARALSGVRFFEDAPEKETAETPDADDVIAPAPQASATDDEGDDAGSREPSAEDEPLAAPAQDMGDLFGPAPARRLVIQRPRARFRAKEVVIASVGAMLVFAIIGGITAPLIFKPVNPEKIAALRTEQAPAAPASDPEAATLAYVKPAAEPLSASVAEGHSQLDLGGDEEVAAPEIRELTEGAADDVADPEGLESAAPETPVMAAAEESVDFSGDAEIFDDAPIPAERIAAEQIVAEQGAAENEPLEQTSAPAQEAPPTPEEPSFVGTLAPSPTLIAAEGTLGNYFRECLDCPDMAELPTGHFVMGAPEGELASTPAEGPPTDIFISKPFAISTSEVTYKQWDACVADGGCDAYRAPDYGWGRDMQPVVGVSYEDAQSYVRWLSGKTGRVYRLPSEAEWEYAARAGSKTALAWGEGVSTGLANYNGVFAYRGPVGEARGRPVAVASFPPNAFGLYDMHGNVWEWTADCWAPSHAGASPEGEPRLGSECAQRVIRGGAFTTGGWRVRSAHRAGQDPTTRARDIGFRVARDLG